MYVSEVARVCNCPKSAEAEP